MVQNKQNKAAQAMKKAWEIFKKWGVRTMAKWSEALKLAWAIVKGLVKEVEKMVELKGTPKQVAWAEDTRKRVIPVLDEIFGAIKPRIESSKSEWRRQQAVFFEQIINRIKTIESAKWWIENYGVHLERKADKYEDADKVLYFSQDVFKSIAQELGLVVAVETFYKFGEEYLFNKKFAERGY